MGATNTKGDLGEARVMYECIKRGYKVAIPHGHDWTADLIVERDGKLERIQIKTTESDGECIVANAETVHFNGKTSVAIPYDTTKFDWLVVFDITSDRCYFVRSTEITSRKLRLRLQPPKNNQKVGIKLAENYLDW